MGIGDCTKETCRDPVGEGSGVGGEEAKAGSFLTSLWLQ